MDNRKVFDHLHGELSVLVGRLVPRMDLWGACFSDYLTKENALIWLRDGEAQILQEIPERKLRRFIRRFERWDPNADTPDEIFARIFGVEEKS